MHQLVGVVVGPVAGLQLVILHPGARGLFLFDNSQNHHAKAPSGLDVNNHNLNDGGKNAKSASKAGGLW